MGRYYTKLPGPRCIIMGSMISLSGEFFGWIELTVVQVQVTAIDSVRAWNMYVYSQLYSTCIINLKTHQVLETK